MAIKVFPFLCNHRPSIKMDMQTIFRGLQIKTFISVYFNLDSVLVGIVYRDLHEILKSNSSNNDATKNSRYLAKTFTDGKIYIYKAPYTDIFQLFSNY